jgi:hypothetical protein
MSMLSLASSLTTVLGVMCVSFFYKPLQIWLETPVVDTPDSWKAGIVFAWIVVSLSWMIAEVVIDGLKGR